MATNEREKDEVTFEITEKIGVLNSYPTGWHKEINMVSWNGNGAKYDIRDWDPEHKHMSRGITLHTGEVKRLVELLKAVSTEEADIPEPDTNQQEEQAM